MSKHAEWAFAHPHNRAQWAPKQPGTSSDCAAVESPAPGREKTPDTGHLAENEIQCTLLALTTDAERMFDPAEGHVFGSDSERYDVILDDTNMRGVSSRHIRLFVDPNRGEDYNCLTIQNLSGNSVRIISHEMNINVSLARGKVALLRGGAWTIILNTKVDIVFDLIFPGRGNSSSEYFTNWLTFRMTNERALPKLRMALRHSAEATPLVNAPTYIIDWSQDGILGRGTFGVVRKARSAVTSEVFAAKVFGVRGDMQHELGFLQILRHVSFTC